MAGLSGLELDTFLQRRIKGLRLLNSQSYERLFTSGGKLKVDIRVPTGVILNTDDIKGPGEHWVTFVYFPHNKTIFYYDPLLPNKEYEIPHNLAMFMSNTERAGGEVVQNVFGDQPDTDEVLVGGRLIPNDQCGAYAAFMLLALDKPVRAGDTEEERDLKVKFFNAHKELQSSRKINALFQQIKHQ